MWTIHHAYYYKDFRRIRQKKYPFAMSWNQSCKDPGSMDTMCDVRFTSLSHRPCVCFPCICYCFLYVKQVLSCSRIKCKENNQIHKAKHWVKKGFSCQITTTMCCSCNSSINHENDALSICGHDLDCHGIGTCECREGQKALECFTIDASTIFKIVKVISIPNHDGSPNYFLNELCGSMAICANLKI
jgi:hypothetical protein